MIEVLTSLLWSGLRLVIVIYTPGVESPLRQNQSSFGMNTRIYLECSGSANASWVSQAFPDIQPRLVRLEYKPTTNIEKQKKHMTNSKQYVCRSNADGKGNLISQRSSPGWYWSLPAPNEAHRLRFLVFMRNHLTWKFNLTNTYIARRCRRCTALSVPSLIKLLKEMV